MVAEKNILTTITSENNMIICAWVMYAGFTCHLLKISKQYSDVKPDPSPTPAPRDHCD